MDWMEISLLGGFQLSRGEGFLNGLVSAKGRALLAFLAIEADRPHQRSTLAAMFWPDQPEPASRANLRQTLHRLRQSLGEPVKGPPYLKINNGDVQFDLSSNCRLDVTRFSQLARACQQHHQPGIILCESCLKDLRTAVEVYRGELLAGISLPGCSEFDWWLTCKREGYHRQMIEILKSLALYYEEACVFTQAIHFIQRALELEPWSESLHRQKMVLLARSDQRIAALRQYDICCEILADELGVEPAKETTLLYQQIDTGTLLIK